LSQHWGMHGSALSTTAHTTRLAGILPSDPQQHKPRRMDLLHFVASRGEVRLEPTSRHVTSTALLDMSRRYPSARWERALHEWSSHSYTHPDYGRGRAKHFASALCTLVNQDLFERNRHDNLVAIEVVLSHWTVNPPGSSQRYAVQPAAVDTIVSVPCLPFPSLRTAEAPSAAI
jgi:peptidoglycan/xylan/chitin deacetylase (PgdA/CDA1 family)